MEIETITIEGNSYLTGEVTLSESVMASKIALIAGILSQNPTVVKNPPDCKTLGDTTEILAFIGAQILTDDGVSIHGESISMSAIPPNKTLTTFELVLIWATLLARFGKAGIPETVIASHSYLRPILEAFGVTVELESHYVVAYLPTTKKDCAVTLPSEMSFEDKVLASLVALTLATSGLKTTIKQCAPSEEFDILKAVFTQMGVHIQGDNLEIVVESVPELIGILYVVPPSSREALLYLALVAVSRGDIQITNFPNKSLSRITKRLLDRGVEFSLDKEVLRVWQKDQVFTPSIQTLSESQRLPLIWQSVLSVISGLSDGESQLFIEKHKVSEIVSPLSSCGVEVTVLPSDPFTSEVRIFGPHKFRATKFAPESYESAVSALLCAQAASGTSEISYSNAIKDVHQNIFSSLAKLGMKIYGYQE
ncbi:hypothetical protein GW793_02405 [bacterium]|uniref:UDP-N-acetylglucosamine 1-carboxyvinyltransferase n=1 Tax=candidate division WWE3 bacterium CG22_combo_CG10-13_8_21_14_all_39_12 TaxID=1975094 RepID=A0A2H0BFE5_UNCKA|nr:hypothetical protein [bacterium]PIP56397.1 MAG: hypothetical protein COX05_03260 [candidate division WWE3 bacterium CG22_combo_CG10-13_8_21_14_all_39_12]